MSKPKADKAPAPIPGIHIPARYIRAALIFAGKCDVRFYINGLRIEPSPTGDEVRLIATNGHAMFVARLEPEGIIPKALRAPMTLARRTLKRRCGARQTIRTGSSSMASTKPATAAACFQPALKSRARGTWPK